MFHSRNTGGGALRTAFAVLLTVPLLGLTCDGEFLTELLGPPVALIACPATVATADNFDIRAFYVPDFPGSSLTRVVIHLTTGAKAEGTFTLRLEARLDTYDGQLIGTSETTTFVGSGATEVTFDFPAALVPEGSTVTFDGEQVSGPSTVLMGVTPCEGVVETEGSTPPLDTPRFIERGVSVTIFGHPAAATP